MFGTKQKNDAPPPLPPKPLSTEQMQDVSQMSFDDLTDLKRVVDREVEARGLMELSNLKEKLLTIASMQGVSIGELFAPPKPERKKREVKVKYRDPETGDEWSGRGKQPQWLESKLEQGATLEQFEVA